MDKRRSVGLVIITEIPGKGKVAVLQIRGEINPEKLPDGIDESFPGGCQVTMHGRVEWYEREDEALIRETHEELGREVGAAVSACIDRKRLLTTHDHGDDHVVTYGLELHPIFLRRVRLGPASGGLRLLTAEEARNINKLDQTDKVHGVQTKIYETSAPFACIGKLTAMFPDEREAVQKALGVSP